MSSLFFGDASRLRQRFPTVLNALAVAFAILLALPAAAADLLQVYRLAQVTDPTIASARHQLDSIRQKIPQARANLLPAVTMSGSEGNTSANTAFTGVPSIDRNMKAWSWNLQLTQPLIRTSNVYVYRESGFIVEQAEFQFAQAQQDLLLRVSHAYFGVLIAQDAIAAADAQVTALNNQLALVIRGYQLGTHSVTDLDDTKSRLGTARAQQVAAQNDLENANADLEKITGKSFDQGNDKLAALQGTYTLPQPSPMDSRKWMDQARVSNPSVKAQRATLEASRQAIKKNRSEHLPTLDLVVNYGSNYTSHSLTTPDAYSTRASQREIGVRLTVPVFSGGGINSRVIEEIANMNKAESDLEAASRQAATDARQAFSGVMNGLAQIAALTEAVVSGQSAVKGNRAGYKLGIRVNVDVLNAEQQLFAAQRDLSKARYDTILQGFKLKAATGSLGETDLLGVNAMLR